MTSQVIEPAEGWAPALAAATREVFDMMLNTPLEVQPGAAADAEMIAMVSLTGRLAGVVSVHCTAAGAREIAAKMLGGSPSSKDENDTVHDAVGEVCNMVAGNFKTKLGAAGADCKLSVPTIIAGGQCYMTPQNAGVHVEIPFQFGGSPLRIVLDLRG